MDYQLSVAGERPLVLRGWGNLPIEVIAALAGVKPVIHCWADEADLGYIKELCAALRFKYLVYTRTGGENGAARVGVMLGAKQSELRQTADLWQRPQSNPGTLLGYPSCCSEFYCDWINRGREDDPARTDIVHRVHSNTPSPNGLPFLLNDVFYLYSRRGAAQDNEKREAIYRMNRGLDMGVMNVIPWHPCSYRCPESLDRGRRIWAELQRQVPALAAVLKSCLAKPVLFWDWSRFAVLRGACDERGDCLYTAVQPPFSLLEADLLALLKSGDRLRRTAGGALEVWKGARRIGPFPGTSPLLLDFVAA